MNKKNVLIFVAGAVVLGILLGVLIGILGGFFKQDSSLAKLPKSNEITTKKDASDDEKKADDKKSEKKQGTQAVADAEEPKTEVKENESDKQEKEEEKKGSTGYIATGTGQPLNVRSAADPASGIITSLANGTEVEVLETTNGMTRIRGAGVEGWVVSSYVSQ